MELRQLRHFVAVAERRNFSDAAARVYLSQPALTRSIQQLERALGAVLLDRSARSVTLTAAGERFLAFARMILAEGERAAEAVRAVDAGTVGDVAVGTGFIYSARITEAVVRRCRAEIPRVRLRTLEAPSEELVVHLRRGRIDFAFASFTPEVIGSGLALEPLMPLTEVLVAGAGHPLARRPGPEPHQLAAARWVTPNRPWSRDVHARYFVTRGLPVPQAIRTNSIALIRGLVMHRGYLAFLPREVVATEIREGTLRIVAAGPSADTRTAGLILPPGERPGEAATRVMQVVREVCAAAARAEAAVSRARGDRPSGDPAAARRRAARAGRGSS